MLGGQEGSKCTGFLTRKRLCIILNGSGLMSPTYLNILMVKLAQYGEYAAKDHEP